MNQNTKYLAHQIIKLLSRYQELPKTGFLAGQAASSAIIELLHIEGLKPIYNDIDIFVDQFKGQPNTLLPSGHKLQLEEWKTIKEGSIRNASVSVVSHKNIVVRQTAYEEVFATQDTYKLLKTERDRMLNTITVTFVEPTTSLQMAHAICSHFDLNCTQVGIDLETMELVATDEFWKFIKTKQLEIVNLNTPAHSLGRSLKKQNELGCYLDYKWTCHLVNEALKNKKRAFGIAYSFGIKTLDLLMNYREKIEKYFEFKINSRSLGEYQSYTLESKIHNILPYTNQQHFLKFTEVEKILTQRNIIDTEILLYRSKQSHLVMIEKMLNKYPIVKQVLAVNPGFFINIELNEKKISAFFKQHTSHDELKRFLLLEGSLAMKTVSEIDEYSKTQEYGNIIFACDGNTSEQCHKEALHKLDQLSKQKAEKLLKQSRVIDDIKIEELASGLELYKRGIEENHCVGGYFDYVKAGRSRIFRLDTKLKEESATAEVTFYQNSENPEKKEWSLTQIRHSHNRKPKEDLATRYKNVIAQVMQENGYGAVNAENHEVPF